MIPKALFVGITTIDFHYMVRDYPISNSKTRSANFTMSTGGPATNAAAAFVHLGGASHLFSVVGKNHPFSEFIYDDLKSCNIRLVDIYPESDRLPTVASVITPEKSGERTIIYSQPGQEYWSNDLLAFLADEKYDLILVDGMNMEACIEIARQGKQTGIPVVLDGGSWKDRMESLLPYITYAICSEDFFPPGISEHNDIFHFLEDSGIRDVSITRGKNSVLFKDKDCTGEIPVQSIDAKDTLGAGDVFHGAFCIEMIRSGDFRRSLKYASGIATESCLHPGAREWMRKGTS